MPLCFREKHLDSLLLLRKVPDPENYGIAEIAGDQVLRVVEKPEKPPGNLVLSGALSLFPALFIFQSIRNISPSRQRRVGDNRCLFKTFWTGEKRWNTGS